LEQTKLSGQGKSPRPRENRKMNDRRDGGGYKTSRASHRKKRKAWNLLPKKSSIRGSDQQSKKDKLKGSPRPKTIEKRRRDRSAPGGKHSIEKGSVAINKARLKERRTKVPKGKSWAIIRFLEKKFPGRRKEGAQR